jgi:uncharacterized surface protein with fasciclin (FAS1) repeats/plastocyanin
MTVNKGDIVVFKMVDSAYQHNFYQMKNEAAYQSCDFSEATKVVDGLLEMSGMTFNGVLTMEGEEVTMDQTGTFYYACSSACGLTVDGNVTTNGKEFPGAYVPGSPGEGTVCDVCHCTGGHHKVAITVVEDGSAPAADKAVVYPKLMSGPKCWTPGAKELVWNKCFMGKEPCEMTVNVNDVVSFRVEGNTYQHNIYQVPDGDSYDSCDDSKAEKLLDALIEIPGSGGAMTNGLMSFMMGHEVKMSEKGEYYYLCTSMCGMTVDGTETLPGQKMPSAMIPGMEAGMTCDVCHCSGMNHKVKITVVESGAPEVPISYPEAGGPACTPDPHLLEVAEGAGSFRTLVAAVTAASLADVLVGEGPLTIMAPTDDAFEAALAALTLTTEQLLGLPELREILMYHAVSGRVLAADLTDGMQVTTLQGEEFTVHLGDRGAATITGGDVLPVVKVINTDVMAANGVIHVIDQVLIPPTIAAAFKAPAAGGDDTSSADQGERSFGAPATRLLAVLLGLISAMLA